MDSNLQQFQDENIDDSDERYKNIEFDTTVNFTNIVYVLVFVLTFAFTLFALFTLFG